MADMTKKPLVEIKGLKKYFPVGSGKTLKAVDDVDMEIYEGETMGLVGESGCGKSTFGRVLTRIYPQTGGVYKFEGEDVPQRFNFNKAARLSFTKNVQMIFQDPYASLDPRMTVGSIIGEGIDIHGLYTGEARKERIYELLELVGLNKEHANRFPHEFSGGQRQRVGIARALAIEPKFIVCDEPISALDVSIQSQVINLLKDLQDKLGLTYLFIAHDLNIVKYISDRISVMYLGRLVEVATSEEIYAETLHPYSQALLSAVPLPNPDLEKSKQRIILEGDVPSPIGIGDYCAFAGRCRYACDICHKKRPELIEVKPGHKVACHRVTPDHLNAADPYDDPTQ